MRAFDTNCQGSFTVKQEAALSYDSETGLEEITNIAIVTHWFLFVELSEKV